MINQLIETAKNQLAQKLTSETQLHTEQIEPTFEAVQSVVSSGLKQQVLDGNIKGLLELFNGNAGSIQNNPIVQNLITQCVTHLTAKLGIFPEQGNKIANMIIPFVMSQFADRSTGVASDEMDLLKILGLNKDHVIMSALGGVLGGKMSNLLGGFQKMF
jgi:hypothetical protein